MTNKVLKTNDSSCGPYVFTEFDKLSINRGKQSRNLQIKDGTTGKL